MFREITFLAAISCAGCAVLPKADQVDRFGTAAAASTSLLQDVSRTHRVLSVRIGEEAQAARFVQGQNFKLIDSPSATLPPSDFSVRIEALEALQDYATALKLAADQGVIDQLEQASQKLGNAAGSVVVAAKTSIGLIDRIGNNRIQFFIPQLLQCWRHNISRLCGKSN